MHLTATKHLRRVSNCGAAAGSVLYGCGQSNQGLRIQILEDQPRGDWGPLRGPFVILDVGQNLHSESLEPLLHQVTDAQTVLRIIRQRCPSRMNIANARILAVEQADEDE